jgi:hypothetical protein
LKGKEMKKQKAQPQDNVWDTPIEPTDTSVEQYTEEVQKVVKPNTKKVEIPEFDLEGLMTDFPTATELERFVFDQRGVVLNLKGRANKLKYQIAMDVLNGEEVDNIFLGNDNPYIDKTELVPIDPIKPTPDRDKNLPDRTEIQNVFYVPTFPHPDEEARAKDMKCHMLFRKYKNGVISFEILGPLDQRPFGEKIDKFGRTRPEVIKWYDPRTGEQTAQREDGTLTPIGKRLRATMQTYRVNKSNHWDVWVDREFVSLNENIAHNPWDLK